jgi:hypothetical protein
VTRSKTQRPVEPAPAPAVDPLADLREPEDDRYEGAAPGEGDAEDAPEEAGRVMVTQEDWDETVAEVVAAWHADPTSMGFLHKNNGTMCGCRYVARVALRTALPIQPDADTLEPTPEPEAQDA